MEVRLVKMNEIHKCNSFFTRMYGISRTDKQWNWEFASSNFESAIIPFAVVEDKGEIVGTQALIPIRMIDQGGVFWTAKSEATILDPAYRGKGLFEEMYRLMFEYADTHGLPYIWGFTQAIKPLCGIGFEIPARVTQMFLPFVGESVSQLAASTDSHEIAGHAKKKMYRLAGAAASSLSRVKHLLAHRRLRGSQIGKNLRMTHRSTAPPDAGDLCKRFIKRFGGKTIYRDADYLRWRIFDNPYLKSIFRAVYDADRLVGWVIVSISDERIAHVVDLIAVAEPQAAYSLDDLVRLLLSDAAATARNMGATALRGWHVNKHEFDQVILRAAKSIGFYHVKRGYTMIVYATDKASQREDHDSYTNWFVTRIFTEGTLG